MVQNRHTPGPRDPVANRSFAPLGLDLPLLWIPRLTPWATFLGRFAACAVAALSRRFGLTPRLRSLATPREILSTAP
jgi:hypothetical protein